MKRRDLIKKLDEAAKSRGLELIFVREGKEHEIYKVGDGKPFSVPRHREINEITAKEILKAAEIEKEG